MRSKVFLSLSVFLFSFYGKTECTCDFDHIENAVCLFEVFADDETSDCLETFQRTPNMSAYDLCWEASVNAESCHP